MRKQTVNPKKIYAIDTGLITNNVSKLKNDEGHKLENLVFNALRQKYKEIYYHKDSGECDFVVIDKGSIALVIQVCLELDSDNIKREFAGLIDALKICDLSLGTVVTLNQEDSFMQEGYPINVVPAHKFL